MKAPKVSILIVTYNSADTIADCLSAVSCQTFKDFEIVLVDNNSRDNTRHLVDSFVNDSDIIMRHHFLTINPGFSGGNNYAMRYASGAYISLLNPDAMPEPTWLSALVKVLDAREDVGICASKMMAFDSGLIDSAADGFSSWLKSYKRGEGEARESFNEPSYVFGACAGAALYRKSMIDEIGFLDDDFFLMHEDSDLNIRAQLAGWKTYYVPTAVVYHKVRSSIGNMSDTAIYYSLRNIEFVRIKNIPAGILLIRSPLLLLYIVLEFLYFALRHRRLILYVRAKAAVIRMLPKMMKKRASLRTLKRITNRELCALFTSVLDTRSLIANGRKILFG